MSFEDRVKFKLAVMKIISHHQEEFETLAGKTVFQINQTGTDKVQVLFSETDGVELSLRPITETETVVR